MQKIRKAVFLSPVSASASCPLPRQYRRRSGGEIQLTDAMLRLAERQRFWGFAFEGRTFDCGSKIGFLAANVAYALSRPDIALAFGNELQRLTAKR